MTVFRLLHCSDFHISTVPFQGPSQKAPHGVVQKIRSLTHKIKTFRIQAGHDPRVLHAFVRWTYLHRQLFHVLLCTGDLATTGSRSDLRRASRLFFRIPTQTYWKAVAGKKLPTLRFLPKGRLKLLPGNHDRYRKPLAYLPGGTEFDTQFASFWSAGQGAQPLARITGAARDVILLSADFSLQQRSDATWTWKVIPGWLGQGRAYANTLADLVSLTQRTRAKYQNQNLPAPVILWAVHFDPFSVDPTLQLLDSKIVIQEAKNEQIPIILCGHTHETKIKIVEKNVVALASGTTMQSHSPQGNDFQIVELAVTAEQPPRLRIRVIWFRYDGKKRFRKLTEETVLHLEL